MRVAWNEIRRFLLLQLLQPDEELRAAQNSVCSIVALLAGRESSSPCLWCVCKMAAVKCGCIHLSQISCPHPSSVVRGSPCAPSCTPNHNIGRRLYGDSSAPLCRRISPLAPRLLAVSHTLTAISVHSVPASRSPQATQAYPIRPPIPFHNLPTVSCHAPPIQSSSSRSRP